MKRCFLTTLSLLLLCAVALPARAQDAPTYDRDPYGAHSFELTPFAAYFFTGDFDSGYYEFDFDDTEVDEGEGFGLLAAFGLGRHLQFELLYETQDTELLIDEGGFFFDDRFVVDLDLEYFHAGLSYQWNPGQVRPFVGFSLGATRFEPHDPGFESESRFSIAFGGGVKVFLGDHLGFRFQGRIFSTFVGDDEEVFCVGRHHRDCFRRDDDTYLVQPELSAGLILAF